MKYDNQPSGITTRSLILALFLIPVNCYWVLWIETVVQLAYPTTIALFFNAVFTMLVLILANIFLKRLSTRFVLSQSELLVIYVMVSIAAGICGRSGVEIAVSLAAHPFWFATPENDWKNMFWQYIPHWLAVDDKHALRGYYEGEATLYTAEHIKAWLVPSLAWFGFFFTLIFTMLCINVIVRKEWIENEKLAYPVIQLPLSMTKSGFFSNKLLWAGFIIAASLDILNGLHHLYPAIPGIYLKMRSVSHYFTEKPWNAIGWTHISFYPFVIGLGFFMPLTMSFSCWFFYLFWKAQGVLGSIIGARIPSWGSRYFTLQSAGAYIGIFMLALWSSKRHLKTVIIKTFGKSKKDDEDSPMRYRTAVLSVVIGLALIVMFCYKAGMSVWVAFAFFAIYFALITAITRMRAELGVPEHDLHYVGSSEILAGVFGVRRLGPRNLTMFSFFWSLDRAHYSDIMPHQLEAFKLANKTRMEGKKLVLAMALAAIAGLFSLFWLLLHISYRVGVAINARGNIWFGIEAFGRLERWLNNPTPADRGTLQFLMIGLLFTFFLAFMRNRFIWWPFHPAGYAVSNSWGMNVIWFPLFISWIIKFLILTYGGLKAHRRTLPFFFGIILGEFTIGSLWTIIGLLFGINTYVFFPY